MAFMDNMSTPVKLVIVVVIAGGLFAAGYFLKIQPMQQENDKQAVELKKLTDENRDLRVYKTKLDDLNRQIGTLQQQLEIQKRIVPDEKEAEKFIHLMQDTASAAGVTVRRYTSDKLNTKEFYTEAPFQMDVDGTYYAVVSFFDKVAKLERIINVSGIKVGTPKTPGDGGHKRNYGYSPSETIVAGFTATTFFSHDAAPTAPVGKK